MKRAEKQMKKRFSDAAMTVDPAYKKNLMQKLQGGDMAKAKKQSGINILQLVRSNILTAAIAIVVIGMVAGASAVINGNRVRKEQLQQVALPTNLDNVLTIDQMREKAQATLPTGLTITGVEIEQENGSVFYKVKYSDGSFRLFDAKTGDAVNAPATTSETNESVPTDFKTNIDIQTARATAQAQKPSGTIKSIELENEHGVVVYVIKFSDGSRVIINATDGTLVQVTASPSPTPTTAKIKTEDSHNEEESETETEHSTSGSTSGGTSTSSGSGSGSDSGSGGHGGSDNSDDD